MPYQTSREGQWPFTTAWQWFINMMAVAVPDFFGCHRRELPKVKSQRQVDNVGEILQKLGGVKVAENQHPEKNRVDHFFRIEGKPIVLILEKDKPVKLIAPDPVVEHVNGQLKEFLG